MQSGLLIERDTHFVSAALRIGRALHITYVAANGNAKVTVRSLESGRTTASQAIGKVGRLVNCSMRLCIVALANEEIQYAKLVLKRAGTGRWVDLAAYSPPAASGHRIDPETPFELAIRANLDQITEQVVKIAGAIAGWLEQDRSVNLACGTRQELIFADMQDRQICATKIER